MKITLSAILTITLVGACGASSLKHLDEGRVLRRGKKCGEKGSLNILLTNDDGFDVPNLQNLYTALKDAGHSVLLVAPYSGRSGSSASITNLGLSYTNVFANASPPLDVFAEGEVGATTTDSSCGTVSAGANPLAEVDGPGSGVYYLDGPPTLSVFFGLDVAGPAFFSGGEIDLVISGPNTGNNFGYLTVHSGTVGAAVTAMNRGYPAIALSAEGGTNDNDCAPTRYNPEVIAALSLEVVDSVICGDEVTLDPATGLNVNIPPTNGKTLADLDKYKFTDTEISVAHTFGYKFFGTLLDCDLYLLQSGLTPEQIELLRGLGNFPGLCSEIPSDLAGYVDTNKKGEFNTVYGDPDFLTVSVSKIQSTYQAAGKKSGKKKGGKSEKSGSSN